jgi:hypothetical protein
VPHTFWRRLNVWIDQEDILQHVRDTHGEGRLGALLRLPLNLGDLGAVRKGFPLAGMPDLYAAIIVGFATIALSRSSVWLTATICQSSYPLKSENGRPLGTSTAYLSCAEIASTPASHIVAIPTVNLLLRLIAALPVLSKDR